MALLILILLLLLFSSPTIHGSLLPNHPTKDKIMNPFDACWRFDPKWSSNRQRLADCAVGFGASAVGGKYGPVYVVTDPSDDPVNPRPGSLRHAAIQEGPLWIIFSGVTLVLLKNELIVNSYKTIDGRGAAVVLGAGGPCVTIQNVAHVIIHGITLRGCRPGKRGVVRSSPTHAGHRLGSDGDAVSVWNASDIWIDHCEMADAYDGLVDVVHGSTRITISNNHFSNHDKVMLFGHVDGFSADKVMKVTVAFNWFGPNLVQRMPRVRTGYAHVANNRYDGWEMYAIGGSSNPTILSEGNYYNAPNNHKAKQMQAGDEEGVRRMEELEMEVDEGSVPQWSIFCAFRVGKLCCRLFLEAEESV
ncbi:hypothetical protein HPP92_002575 [Vanilla planifolia]|uniref:Pectate lyase n=1 Tax=Vanilla planifolia TaxID=51239 RepID=A0A835SEZ0_VANPL|nr:hypothetical protein HPP92_002575 [Vanilla planifolia]